MSKLSSQFGGWPSRFAAIFALAFFCTLGASFAQEKSAAGDKSGKSIDPVIVKVDGSVIRQSDVTAALDNLPPQYASIPRQTLIKAVTEKLIDGTLAANRARAMGLQNDPALRHAMAQAEIQLLEQLYIQRLVERRITDRALKRRYERDRKSMVRDKEVRARHILVETRKEALDILAQLRRGKDFAELARTRSTGPSKTKGGDLGFFKREQMEATFSAAAFALRKGEMTRAPVKTKWGWHVIKVEDIKAAAPPRFAEVQEELRQKMSDEVVDKEMKNLRKGAKIERLSTAK